MGVTVVTSDSNVIVNTSQKVISSAPSGWDEQISEYGRGYNYPQPTGQTTVYRNGDDADIEATVFAPVRVANSLKVQNSLVDFLTLGNTNSFGNTDKFTDINGLQVYGDGLIIDNYTGIMWYKVYLTADTWNNQIDIALASTQGGYNDWFLPNTNQIEAIRNKQSFRVAPFDTLFKDQFSSTTRNNNTLHTFRYTNTEGDDSATLKTNLYTSMMCRKHF